MTYLIVLEHPTALDVAFVMEQNEKHLVAPAKRAGWAKTATNFVCMVKPKIIFVIVIHVTLEVDVNLNVQITANVSKENVNVID